MIAYVFIGIKLSDIMMIWRIMRTMASMMTIRCSAGRMAWNGFVLVFIETIIDMLLMYGSNRNVIMTPGIIIGSCGFMILMIAGALAIIEMEWNGHVIMVIMIVISIILIIAMIICSLMFNDCLSYDVNEIYADNACIPPIMISLSIIICFQCVHESSECLTGRVRSE